MATQIELAQLSAATCRHTREENRILPPAGWTMIRTHPDVPQTKGDETGLSASVFRGPGGEIDIALAGTHFETIADWWQANLPAALGDHSPHVQRALEFAAAGITDASWQQYRAAQASSNLPAVFALREAKVAHVFVTNEALAALRFRYTAIVGPEQPLDSGSANAHASGTQLHSMLLAWAMLSNSAFADEIRKLPRLFALIDDAQLFGRTRTTEDQDFLSLLLKFEQGTGMLAQFTGDVQDISGKFAAASAAVNDALVALTVAHYYRMSNGFDANVGEAVKNIVGGLEIALGSAGWSGRGFGRAYELLREMVDLLSGGGADLARGWLKERLVIAAADNPAVMLSDQVLATTADDRVQGTPQHDAIVGLEGDDHIARNAIGLADAPAGWDLTSPVSHVDVQPVLPAVSVQCYAVRSRPLAGNDVCLSSRRAA